MRRITLYKITFLTLWSYKAYKLLGLYCSPPYTCLLYCGATIQEQPEGTKQSSIKLCFNLKRRSQEFPRVSLCPLHMCIVTLHTQLYLPTYALLKQINSGLGQFSGRLSDCKQLTRLGPHFVIHYKNSISPLQLSSVSQK